ncbi:histidine phosphatase family protein [Compostimonas suwonensis]|uniref:histidine phosphatase family protein n=1 Tax=Compostimonas suwonensis TaxID=1048394 RepID=UPI000C23CA89|nr:histidine phosphatase family protein [Compostimonas suwonensis]
MVQKAARGSEGTAARVVLVRHGETEWSRDGRHTGLSDIHLTELGERQARGAGTMVAGRSFGLVLSSPLERARMTARLAGFGDGEAGAGAETDADLVEWDYGPYEGLTSAQIAEEYGSDWTIWRAGTDGSPRPGETAEAVGERADAVLARISPVLERGDDVLLVAHGHVLRILAARWLGLPAVGGALLALGTGSVSELGYEHDTRVITHWNLAP